VRPSALELLEGRPDFLDEVGNAQIVLGRHTVDLDAHSSRAVAIG
jgi:hypothetical protein